MKFIHILILAVLLIFSSCDCVSSFRGTVVDESFHPIEGVTVYYMIEGDIKDSSLTSSNGFFEVDKLTGICNPRANDIILTKNGYRSLVLNEYEEDVKSSSHFNKDTIVMEASSEAFSEETLFKLTSVHNFFNFFNVLVVVINVVTIFYILLVKEKIEFLWVIPFLLINPFYFMNLDKEMYYWEIVGFVADPNVTNRPWVINMSIPLVAVIYWLKVKYFERKKH